MMDVDATAGSSSSSGGGKASGVQAFAIPWVEKYRPMILGDVSKGRVLWMINMLVMMADGGECLR